MRAPPQIKPINHTIGLIAGQGAIPELLVSRWEEQGLTPVIVGLKDITSPSLLKNRIASTFAIGHAGEIFEFLNQHHVKNLVMIGAMTRPNFWSIIPDGEGLSILLKLLLRRRGDDSLLRFVRSQIEQRGFKVVGAHEYLPEIICPSGTLGEIVPTDEQRRIMVTGFAAAKHHGAADKGQSVIVTPDGVHAVESKSGTNVLILSAQGLQNAILVKTSKPQQDLALDMPTIGLSTVDHAVKAGLKGIAVESGKTMIVDKYDVIRACNTHGLFLVGL